MKQCTQVMLLHYSDILITKTKTRMSNFTFTETKTKTEMILKNETI